MKCPYCKHVWNYKGSSTFYVTCPHCYNKVSLRAIVKRRKK